MTQAVYERPRGTYRQELVVARSRFIATIGKVETVDEAKAFLAAIQAEMPDADHHVYAYVVGHGASVIEGMSDAGEPSGSAGPPVYALVRGSKLGDVIVVVTRYFGGTKLGIGGLVRAYSDAARAVLQGVAKEQCVPKVTLAFTTPYALYERIVRLTGVHDGEIVSEQFGEVVAMEIILPERKAAVFQAQLSELSAGSIVTKAARPDRSGSSG